MVSSKKVTGAILAAALLWFYMFSPWTKGLSNFWISMTISALVLSGLSLGFSNGLVKVLKSLPPKGLIVQALLGIAIAAALWGIFWLGDKLSSLMFNFARPEVDAVYSMKEGFPQWLIALLLILVIGPAEEIFWRGFVQASLAELKSPDFALVVSVLIYTLVHLWSFNFMLIMAALVAGSVWGLLYRIKPQWLPALIVSHALWDAAVFVIFPI